jgi:hypothetical protein
MSSRRITFSPRTSMAPEEAREIRARAWAFVFECWRAKQEGGPATVPDEAQITRKERGSAWSDEKRKNTGRGQLGHGTTKL